MHFLISPNAFKNTLTAGEAAAAILEGLQQTEIEFTYELFPVGDGGDGTGDLLIERFKGIYCSMDADDPLGRTLHTHYGLIDDRQTAVIEMTYASGIKHLQPDELDPMRASSYGTGQLMKHAIMQGARKLIIPMGGSATVDGGTGILRALGYRFYDGEHKQLHYIVDMHQLKYLELSPIHDDINNTDIIVLCDVRNTLCGPSGAATVYGPQKGAGPDAVKVLDESLHRLAVVMEEVTGKSILNLRGGGTAGGAAAGLYAMLNAKLVQGIDYFLDLTSFNTSLSKASIVITGEGSLDAQTMEGKAPFGVASRAKAAGKITVCIAGILPKPPDESMRKLFDFIFPTIDTPKPINKQQAVENLRNTTRTCIEAIIRK